MSYEHESDPQQPHSDGGADPTEAYQATAEWDPISEDEAWEQDQDEVWDDDPADGEEWDEEQRAGGAKQTISVAADRITRWFSGLDRRPEYEDHFQGGDPVAEVTPEAESPDGFPVRPVGQSGLSFEIRVSAPVLRSFTKTSGRPLVSPGTRLSA